MSGWLQIAEWYKMRIIFAWLASDNREQFEFPPQNEFRAASFFAIDGMYFSNFE